MRGHRMTDQEYKQWQMNKEDAAYARCRKIEKILYEHFKALDTHAQETDQQELTPENLDKHIQQIYLSSKHYKEVDIPGDLNDFVVCTLRKENNYAEK